MFHPVFTSSYRKWSFCYKSSGDGVGHVCLNLNFRQIFPQFYTWFYKYRLKKKKNQKCLISYVKNYFNRKSVEVQPWTPLEVILNEFCLWIIVCCMQRSRNWVLPHWIRLYQSPLTSSELYNILIYHVKGTSVFFHKTVWLCHVYCNFNIGFTCRITVIFWTLKDGSLLINTLASNIYLSYRNMF